MKRMLVVAVLGFCAFLGTYNASAASQLEETVPEVHITRDGVVSIKGLKIYQRANTTLFGRTSWDESLIRWTIKTNTATDFRKRFGDKTLLTEIGEDDYISIEGYVEGGTSLSIMAKKVVDWSDYSTQSSFSGTVKFTNLDEKQFTLLKPNDTDVIVELNATSTVYRNRREILPRYIRIGDVVETINGTYDQTKNKILAQLVKISIDPKLFAWKNYQGKLKTLPSTEKPIKFMLTVDGKDYAIVLSDEARVLNTLRKPVTFDRFLVGDTVRVYGHIREDNDELDTINVDVVRNLAF